MNAYRIRSSYRSETVIASRESALYIGDDGRLHLDVAPVSPAVACHVAPLEEGGAA